LKADLAPDELGKQFILHLSDAHLSGVTPANYKKWEATPDVQSSLEFSKDLAQKEFTIYADALFGPNWQSDADTTAFVNRTIVDAGVQTQTAFQTQPGANSQDIEAYKSWYTIDAVRVDAQSDTGYVEEIDFTEHNNADKNRSTELTSGTVTNNDNVKETALVTFTKDGDVMRASKLSFRVRD
jgi:hypothetical protein